MASLDLRPSRIAVCNLALATETFDERVDFSFELEKQEVNVDERLLDWVAGAALDAVDGGLCDADSCIFTITRGEREEKFQVCDPSAGGESCSVHEESIRILHTDSCDGEELRQQAYSLISQSFESDGFLQYLTDMSGVKITRLDVSPLLGAPIPDIDNTKITVGGLSAVILAGFAFCFLGCLILWSWSCNNETPEKELAQTQKHAAQERPENPREDASFNSSKEQHPLGALGRQRSNKSRSPLFCLFPFNRSYDSFYETDSERPIGIVRPVAAIAVPTASFDSSFNDGMELVDIPFQKSEEFDDMQLERRPGQEIPGWDGTTQGSEIILGKPGEKLKIVSVASRSGSFETQTAPDMSVERGEATYIDAILELKKERTSERRERGIETDEFSELVPPDAPGVKFGVKSASSFGTSVSGRPSLSASSIASSALRSVRSALFSTRSEQTGLSAMLCASSDVSNEEGGVLPADEEKIDPVLSAESLFDGVEATVLKTASTGDSSLFDVLDEEVGSSEDIQSELDIEGVEYTQSPDQSTMGDDERSSRRGGSCLDECDTSIERDLAACDSHADDEGRSEMEATSDAPVGYDLPGYLSDNVNFVRAVSPQAGPKWQNRKSVQL